MGLWAELRQRKLVQWTVAYVAAAFALLQGVDMVAVKFGWPDSVGRFLIIASFIGFFVTLLLAWYHGERGAQKVSGPELLLLAMLLTIGGAMLWKFAPAPAGADAASTSTATAAAPVPASSDVSIAVLPFVDMSQAHDQEYFSDGLSEELLNLLAQLPQLKVIARTSSFSFKGKEVDVATIARQLNVANVLEGSVRKSGNTLRITAQLVRTSDSTHLWSQTYDRELTDVFKVQDEIAAAVVAALKVKLLPGQDMSSARRSSNTEAYNQYLLGNGFADRENPENWRRAVTAYEKAMVLDPGYGAAQAAMAVARARLADNAGDAAAKEQSIVEASKAIVLSPQLADGYLARGTALLSFKRDWTGAEADFAKAMALDPNFGFAQGGHDRLLIARGRLPEAIAALRKRVERDPLAAGEWGQLGRMLNAAGDFAAAREALDRSLEINPESDVNLFHRGMNELLQHRPQEAMAYFTRSGSGYGGAGKVMALHSLGDDKASQRELDAEIAGFAKGAAYQIAEAYAWRGETDKAFEWLERAYAQNDGGLTFIKADPLMASIAHDPRFAAFLKKLGLTE